jgi:hypothetical protein
VFAWSGFHWEFWPAAAAAAGGDAVTLPTKYSRSYAGSAKGLIEVTLTAGPGGSPWCGPHPSAMQVRKGATTAADVQVEEATVLEAAA